MNENSGKLRRQGISDHRRYWLHLLKRDTVSAERMVDEALEKSRPQAIYLRLFAPALTMSGVQFFFGRITYHDEHFITHHTLRFMRRVRRRMLDGGTPPGPNAPVALATGVGQDSHRIGLRMVCDMMEAGGWRTRWLTTNERGTLLSELARGDVTALLMSIGSAEGIELARRMVHHARRTGWNGAVAIGGRFVATDASACEFIGADVTAAHGLELLHRMQKWLAGQRAGLKDVPPRAMLEPTGDADSTDAAIPELAALAGDAA